MVIEWICTGVYRPFVHCLGHGEQGNVYHIVLFLVMLIGLKVGRVIAILFII